MSNIPPYQNYQPQPRRGLPGWAWAVIAVGGLGCCCAPLAAVLLPVFSSAKLAAQETRTLSETKQIALAAIIFASDHDDKYPSFGAPSQIVTQLKPYTNNNPKLSEKIRDYQWNSELAGKSSGDLTNADQVWMCRKGPDAAHYVFIGFADGHAKRYREPEVEKVFTVKPLFEKRKP